MHLLSKPDYHFENPLFKKNPLYLRLAKEHIAIASLDSEVIRIEVAQTKGELQVPEVYHIHYLIKGIVGIDAEQHPVFGYEHVAEIAIPPKYPVEPPRLYMKTDYWHPNIKWEGAFKGRICGNIRDFGKGYDLYQLILRIGEILQYKNYHAVHTPPYPEDAKVAEWVIRVAEPMGIVSQAKKIVVDNSPLTRQQQADDAYSVWDPGAEPAAIPAPQAATEIPDAEPEHKPMKLKILGKSNPPASEESEIKIRKKDD